jgi:hypothetical protein
LQVVAKKKVVKKIVVRKKPAKKEEPLAKPEDEEQEGEEEEEEVKEDEEMVDEDEDDKSKANAKAYKKFWSKLASAPVAVQNQVKEIKALHFRAGKQKKLQELALAFQSGGWDHKVFKSIQGLEEERSKAKETKAIPRVLMRAKCGGEDMFNQASVTINV